jgi:Tol biopolymer transport system component
VHFLRTNRHASAIITAALLVVIGVVVGLTRHDPGDKTGVVLRADQQALQPAPTVTVPGDIVGRTPTANGGEPAPMTLGKFGAPIHAPSGSRSGGTSGGAGGGGVTDTTSRATSATTSTTTIGSTGAFGAGRIAYTASATVWTVNADGGDVARLATPAYSPAWSPDHRAIAYADADSPGGVLHVATAEDNYALTTGVAKDSQPAWSPDGKTIAFARVDTTQPTEYSEIWLVNRDATNTRQVTHLPCFNREPSWSPDGKKLVFWSSSDHCTAGPGQGNYELYVINVDGSGLKRLGTTANSGAPAWSPDGKSIAFSCDGYGGVGFEICVMNADGTNAHRITNLSGDQADPAWSPDGKALAFVNGGSLWTMKSDGSAAKQLVAGAVSPAWY